MESHEIPEDANQFIKGLMEILGKWEVPLDRFQFRFECDRNKIKFEDFKAWAESVYPKFFTLLGEEAGMNLIDDLHYLCMDLGIYPPSFRYDLKEEQAPGVA